MRKTVIKNRERLRQVKDFTNLNVDNRYPTDIDYFYEFRDRGYLIGDLKLRSHPKLSGGQQKAIERLLIDLSKTGKTVIGFIATHDAFNPANDIDVAKCLVYSIWRKGHWTNVEKKDKTLLSLQLQFEKEINKG